MSKTSSDQLANLEPRSATPMRGAVRLWLIFIAVLIAAMVIVGGATRLTDSGLSITEWKVIMGAIPPLSQADWQAAFDLYKEIPEYRLINRDMTLESFKTIFWWEWGHRFLGRFIGLAFLVPFVFFGIKGALTGLWPRLLLLFVLGGAQGALGWYMVQSGLVDRVDVSQYRLAAHLGFAVALLAYVLWLIMELGHQAPSERFVPLRGAPIAAMAMLLLIFVQILFGAFVAGMDAGMGYNTWPLMDGSWVPRGLFVMSPAWLNLFENAMTVQFTHRILAYVVTVAAVAQVMWLGRHEHAGALRGSSSLVLAAVMFQVVLGVATLLQQVPISLGLLHQLAALVVLGLALNHLHIVCRGTGAEKAMGPA
jgi:cytochrome c oxidase assembly protein subunit 15